MDMNDDLLICYLLGEASPGQVKQVDEWLASSIENQKRLSEYKAIWETSRHLKYEGELDAAASLRALKARAEAQTNSPAKVNWLRSWYSIAATLLLLAGCAWLYFGTRTTDKQLVTQTVIETDTLSDGSIITLNKNSRLKYPERFAGSQRRVTLAQGEAFFNIAHNKAKPFIITAGSTNIRVVGTSFNVKYKHNKVEVIVETGVVQVSRNGHMVQLTPGQKIVVAPNQPQLKTENNPDQLYTYYRSKEFVANDAPLWRMVQVLNEAYDAHIVIENKTLNNLPLNTTFKNESLDDVLQVISRTFNISVEHKGRQIILR